MKRNLVFFLMWISFAKFNAQQITFCPPGAEWHYGFYNVPAWAGIYNYENAGIKYTGDSIIGLDTLKILRHSHFYLDCNFPDEVKITLIKQKGDTVFFKNTKTLGSWQILYNYACTPGTGWQTTILGGNSGFTGTQTFTYMVTAVSYTTINGVNLKQLNLGGYKIIERLGWSGSFLFNFYSERGCDGFYYRDMFCYQDAQFGLKQFTDKLCGFSGIDGINQYEQNSLLKIYPNPVRNSVTLELDQSKFSNSELRIMTMLGEKVKVLPNLQFEGGLQTLDLPDVKSGVYVLEIFKEGRLIAAQKLIKD